MTRRFNHAILLLALCLAGWLPSPAAQANERVLSARFPQVSYSCMYAAASRYQVPLALLYAIHATEGGKVGSRVPNTDGSYDLGPMQINTWWLPRLSRYGVQQQGLINDGCLNVQVSAWILSWAFHDARGDFWRAVGYYHSRNPKHYIPYSWRVYRRLLEIQKAIS